MQDNFTIGIFMRDASRNQEMTIGPADLELNSVIRTEIMIGVTKLVKSFTCEGKLFHLSYLIHGTINNKLL